MKNFRGKVLFDFFSLIENSLLDYGMIPVNNKMNKETNRTYLYDLQKCSNWFDESSNIQMFGAYFDFGDNDFLFHIEVGLTNLHIGFVKYKLIDDKYQTIKMDEEDYTTAFNRYGFNLPKRLSLKARTWGNVWCSIDLGNFKNFNNDKVLSAILNFKKSDLFSDIEILIKVMQNNKNMACSSSVLNVKKVEYKPQHLNFRVSYKCNIFCKHCYNSSSNKEQGFIDKKVALKVITQAYKYGIKTLGLTGGEPMLFPDIINAMIKKATDLGYTKINITTNGYWGKTLKGATDTLNELNSIGFKPGVGFLGISAGEFHREFLDWSHHRNIIIANHNIFGHKLRVDFEYREGHAYLVDDFKKYLAENGVDSSWYNLVVRSSLSSVGRWKENQSKDPSMIPAEKIGSCKPTNWFTVEPNGDVFPCCGFNKDIHGLAFGNVHKSSVAKIISNAEKHLPIKALYTMTLGEIHTKMAEHIELPKEYNSICQACEYLFKDTKNHKYLK